MNIHRMTQLLTVSHDLRQPGLARGMGKAVLGAVGVATSLGLAGPVERAGVAPPDTAPEFLAAARAAGITGPDAEVLDTGRDVCRKIWSLHTPGSEVAGELARDGSTVASDDASNFVLATFNHLCPTPAGYDYWTSRTY